MKNLSKIIYIVFLLSCGSLIAGAQTKSTDKKAAKLAQINKLITNENYVFKANYVIPTRGEARNLTSDYDMIVSKDTITAFLPYFGRAYLADYGSTEGGIKFTITKFEYKLTDGKKGSYVIFITPNGSNFNDPKAVKSMRLDISPDGYASLQVMSLNRDPISFNGYIEERKMPVSN